MSIILITVFTVTSIIGGVLINGAVFLTVQHIQINPQKKETRHGLKVKEYPKNGILGRRYHQFVNRPLNTQTNQKKAFYSLFNLSPNPNTKYNKNNNQNINSSNSSFNAASFINANNNNNNKQYDILMNNQYVNILSFIIEKNIDTPLYLKNAFNTTLDPEQINVSNGAQQIMFEENAGGQSELSEGFSFEILRKCFGAKLKKTEMAIKYWWTGWKKTDYSIKINNTTIGVSVTRAMKYKGIFNKYDAMRLMRRKLYGINQSTIGVLQCDQWQRQILHIWATHKYIENILYETYLELLFREPHLVQNTIILVSVASKECEQWIFYQDKYLKKKNLT